MNHKFPWFSFERQLFLLYRAFVFKKRFKHLGSDSFVSPFSEIINMQNISIGDKVSILSGAWIMTTEKYANDHFKPSLAIGNNTYIGHNLTLSCTNRITIGEDVTFGDNVYVADCTHSYEDIKTSIMKQKLKSGQIAIGNRAWIGKNSVIAYDLEIGEHAVIGANSFVNKSVPAYTIVVGNPAVPVKKYDFNNQQWVAVGATE
jgi:acetyltransferase-like isoleucine patch superfamily enzyme